MSGSTRGFDLNSWWANRRTYRHEAIYDISKLRDLQRKFSVAGAGAASTAVVSDVEESIAGLSAALQQIAVGPNVAHAALARAASARAAAESELTATRQRVSAEALKRCMQEAEREAAREANARRRGVWLARKMFQAVAVGVCLGTLYILYAH